MILARKYMISKHIITSWCAFLFFFFLTSQLFGETETLRLLSANVQAACVNDNTIFAVFSNAVYACSFTTKRWQKVSQPAMDLSDEPIRDIAVSPASPVTLFLLTRDNLFISKDSGTSWIHRRLASQTRNYYTVSPHPTIPSTILLASSDGVWISRDNGEIFERFFTRVNSRENDVRSIGWDKNGARVYLATQGGVFLSSDAGATFQKVLKLPPDPVTYIATSPMTSMHLAFVSGGRLFFSDSGLVRYWLVSELYDFSSCTSINIAWNGADIIWSYPGGLLWGKEWLIPVPRVPQAHTISNTDTQNAASYNSFSAVEQDSQRAGPPRQKEKVPPSLEPRYERVMQIIRKEPSARDVVDAAIEYAHLHPEEIDAWLKNLRKSTWLPDVRFLGNTSMKDGSFYGTEGMGTWGRSVRYRQDRSEDAFVWETGAELSWRLGSFIYDTDEIRIDERRARQTELREDVANTVTIYYFQRRNYVFKKLFDPPESFEELSRLTFQIEELTTKLDTLSGGYFNKNLPDEYRAHGVPEYIENKKTASTNVAVKAKSRTNSSADSVVHTNTSSSSF